MAVSGQLVGFELQEEEEVVASPCCGRRFEVDLTSC